jgi:O-antigen/teichoic acid export membrane protein
MGLGLVFWLIAARLFEQGEVGVAAGVVAAMMLCTQLGLLGLGSAVIALYPAHRRHPAPLLDSAMTLAALSALLASAGFLLLAGGVFSQLDVAASTPAYAGLFVAASVLGTLGIVFDQTATALRRGDQALARNVVFGVAAVAALAAAATLLPGTGSAQIFMPWALAGVAAFALGAWQLRRALGRYRLRPRLDRRMVRELRGVALRNHLLTVAERSPGLVLPILVTELLSPAANASWYGAWMMAWVIFIVPIQVGLTLFSELAHEPDSCARAVRGGIRTSLAIGTAGALVVAAAADLLLSLLGPSYAEAGATPLRILVLGVVPLTFVQAYFAACRARNRLPEAIVAGWVTGAAAVAAACAAGVATGLVGMAVAWLAVQSCAGAVCAWRLQRLLRELRAPRGHALGRAAPVAGAAVEAGSP